MLDRVDNIVRGLARMNGRGAFREDIQALRGIAVLLVLLFHAKIGALAAGYLGVDIFFVLSGYLITGLVARRLAEDRFSFAEFYLNRAKRLLPAAYVVYSSAAIAAYWFLTDSEFDQLLKTLWGALTFTANFTLWLHTNYFATGAKFNALLHVWSLSIEEQFYFILPLALFLTPKRLWLGLTLLGGLGSLALCLYLSSNSPVAAFYLLPARAWELALGGALALAERRPAATHSGAGRANAAWTWAVAWLGLPALAVLILTPSFAPGSLLGSRHPGLDAILVCAATALLLICRLPLLTRGALAWTLARLGDISYSLYLVHWPLFALATNAYLGETPPLSTRIWLLVTSIILAVILYTVVENPIRRRSIGGLRVQPALVAMVATAVVAVVAAGVHAYRASPRDYADLLRPNYGLDLACDFGTGEFKPLEACRTGAVPTVLVWGDSLAMHLVPALTANSGDAIAQATMSMCGPALGIAQFTVELGLYESWAEKCIGFNNSVLAYLKKEPSIKTVVLSSAFFQFTREDARGLLLVRDKVITKHFSEEEAVERLAGTIKAVQETGREVVIVGPTPTIGIDMASCMMRQEMRLITAGRNRECEVHTAEAIAYRAPVINLINKVVEITGARFIDLIDHLCGMDFCRTTFGGIWLYRDAGHLTVDGSHELGRKKVIAITDN
ncbi:MAG: acyltransferase family protein [Rhodomicrobium sp.]